MNAVPSEMSDEQREAEIERWRRFGCDTSNAREARREAFALMGRLIADRSPEQILRMELKLGLAR